MPSGGARALCLLSRFSKVSRRQGGTLSGRDLNNGYVPGPAVLTVRPSSQASQLPHLDRGVSDRDALAGGPSSQASQLPHLDRGVSDRDGGGMWLISFALALTAALLCNLPRLLASKRNAFIGASARG
ncbi:hypothetical protein METHPM2_2660002 [Pseudomonas sp. PM2]